MVKILLIAAAAMLVAVVVALPLVVPPLASRMAMDELADRGFMTDIRLGLGYCWRNGPGVKGTLDAALLGTPWRVKADFGASCSEWSAHVELPETPFSEADPLLAKLLKENPLPGVSNLVFSGSVSVEATAERTFRKPVAQWRAKAAVWKLDASCVREGRPLSVRGLSLAPDVFGIADYVDIRPLYVKADSVEAVGAVLTNLRATVRMSERMLMVSEASAGFCGGTLNAYSFFLDPKRLNAGVTLFMDNIDAGAALRHVNGFQGDATGRLHGKLRVFVREGGKSLRLSDAFLYSTPGEVGKLNLRDKRLFAESLAHAGLDEPTRENVAEALSDLDYKVLRMDIRRLEDKMARLTVRIAGTATRGDVSAPVDVTVNINGELEQIINTGLGLSAKMKGLQQ